METEKTYKKCNGCGNKFSKRACTRNGLLYCTVKCYKESISNYSPFHVSNKRCLCCNKPIFNFKGLRKKGLYCDKECYNQHRVNSRVERKKKCLYCDNEITGVNKKYCNNKCYGKHKVELTKLKHKNIIECLNCENEFNKGNRKERKYCTRKCYIEHKHKTKFTVEIRNELIKGFSNMHNTDVTIELLSESVGLSKMSVGKYFTKWLSNRNLLFNKEEYMKDLEFQMYSIDEMDYATGTSSNKKYHYESLSDDEKEIYNNLNGKKYERWNKYYLK